MFRIVAALLAALLLCAQTPMLPGFPPGTFQNRAALDATGGGATFQGLGDIKAGWSFVWGTRAFSAATRGNKLLNICNSTGGVDVLCADASSDPTTGQLVIPGLLSTFCPGSVCTIKTFYELTGSTNCGAPPCDATDIAGVVANRAVLTANAIGTRSCGVSAGAVGYALAGGGNITTTVAQPLSITGVAKFAGTSGSQLYFGTSSGGSGIGTGLVSTPDFAYYGSSIVNGPPSDTSAHAFQNVLATTSSFMVVDTTTGSTQNSGGTSLFGGIGIFSDAFSNRITGALCEVGVYPAAFNGTDATNLNTNQHSSSSGYNF